MTDASTSRTDTPPEGAALQVLLRRAQRLALAGEKPRAAALCATAVLDHQPLLEGSPGLLRLALVVLLDCDAFGQAERLVRAVLGRQVRLRIGRAEVVIEPSRPIAWDAAASLERGAHPLVAAATRRGERVMEGCPRRMGTA